MPLAGIYHLGPGHRVLGRSGLGGRTLFVANTLFWNRAIYLRKALLNHSLAGRLATVCFGGILLQMLQLANKSFKMAAIVSLKSRTRSISFFDCSRSFCVSTKPAQNFQRMTRLTYIQTYFPRFPLLTKVQNAVCMSQQHRMHLNATRGCTVSGKRLARAPAQP